MDRAIIRVEGLRVAYGEQLVLQDVALQVDAGEMLTIIGNSGCGKSTLLKAVVGLVTPQAGRVELFSEDFGRLNEAQRGAVRRRCGVMFQHGALLNSLSILENVALPLEMHTDLSAARRESVAQARLEMVGLGAAHARLPSELSGGMRKRAALARAMALDPEILLCDEPGAGLDPATAAEIDALLLSVNRNLGTAVVVVTHELLSIARLDGRIVMLDEGRCVFSGPLAQARRGDQPAVRRFFAPDLWGDP